LLCALLITDFVTVIELVPNTTGVGCPVEAAATPGNPINGCNDAIGAGSVGWVIPINTPLSEANI
jgi:hypothetical protein